MADLFRVKKSGVIANFFYIHRNDHDGQFVGTIGHDGEKWRLLNHCSEFLDSDQDIDLLINRLQQGVHQFKR